VGRHPPRALDVVQGVRGATVAAVTAPGETEHATMPVPPERQAAIAERILDIVERQMDATERVLATVNPKDQGEGERSTRMLASIIMTLRETAALVQPDQANSSHAAVDDPVPSDVDEFRRQLAQRIRGFIEGERKRTGALSGQ
jgi:hypothetical protein